MNRPRTALVVLLALLFSTAMLAGCGQGNPILGRWRVDEDASPPGSAVGLEIAGSAEIEFRETRMVAGSSSLDVTYAVEKDRVIVTTTQGQGTVYVIESEDTMSVETPMGPIVFRRIPDEG